MERKLFILNKGGHRYNNNEQGFRKMRYEMMMDFTKLFHCNIGRLADFFDDVRNMETSSEVFVADSEMCLHTSNSIERFEKSLNYWTDFAERNECHTVEPSYFHMYVIKKTAKHYIVKPIDYECVY